MVTSGHKECRCHRNTNERVYNMLACIQLLNHILNWRIRMILLGYVLVSEYLASGGIS